jgi:arginase
MARIRIHGVPLDLGASRRGVDMGPSALRIARLGRRLRALGHEVRDEGNLEIPDRDSIPGAPERAIDLLPAIAEVAVALAARTAAAAGEDAVPVVLGGDHSLAAGSVAGVARAFAARDERIGLIWLDAHGDLNTPDSSPSGNVHGMPLAHLLGHGDPRLAGIGPSIPTVRASNAVVVGARDLDPGERRHAREWDVRIFTMRDIDERGMRAVMAEALAIAGRDTAGIYVSCDADFVDPREAPGVGTPVRGGATYREAHLAMEMVADSGALVGLDMVEVNPVLDDINRTAELCAGLVASAFGQRIL